MFSNRSSKKKALPMVALIGADGCGKSSVLTCLANNFKHASIRDVYILNDIHNLTFMNTKSEPGKPIRNYAKPPHSSIYSIAKLCLMACLWLIKFNFELAPMKRSNVLILCDHFYFLGMALDPLKYRYGAKPFLLKFMLGIIPKPDIFILLDAPLDVVYGRRQEATRDEVHQLMQRHREYISMTPRGYVVNAAEPVEQVAANISQIILQTLE